MKLPVLVLLVWGLAGIAGAQEAASYEATRQRAEALYAEHSYAKAREVYESVPEVELGETEKRWLEFRLADTLWRSEAATTTNDSSKFEQAQEALEKLVRDVRREEERDRVWAEVHESLGDFHWTRRDVSNWQEALPHYQHALDWWAGARDIEAARGRYLEMVWKMARPPHFEPYESYGQRGNWVPIEILRNAVKIAKTETDLAHAHYLLAMTVYRVGGDANERARVGEAFEAAIKTGKSTEWLDDALFNYAQWLENQGRQIRMENGGLRNEPDYEKALEIYRRLVETFRKGESRYHDQARERIRDITRTTVSVAVPHVYFPGSEVELALNWRNTDRVDLAIHKVSLPEAVAMGGSGENAHAWIQKIDLSGSEKVRSWSRETRDAGKHQPGNETVRLEEKLPTGAYVLVARAGGEEGRDLLLVSDAAVVLKTSPRQALVYFCDARNGSPVADAEVRIWVRDREGNRWRWNEQEKRTNADGLAVFDLNDRPGRDQVVALAAAGERQAFSLGYSNYYRSGNEPWRIYAFTDRPVYRPNETVQWKFVARRQEGSVFVTPDGETVELEVTDPQGAKIASEKVKLNAFGSASGSIELTKAMPLGEYRVQFWDEGRRNGIGSATLFRLEEYKLPEFKVSVKAAEPKERAYRMGDEVGVEIMAEYYFGGPVANAEVEVVVYQRPFHHFWFPERPYPWLYRDMESRPSFYGQGQVVKREHLKTDVEGHARLSLETPAVSPQDLEFRVEARVTDASRREIVGSDTVRVTREPYFVHLRPEHQLYRPQDKVTIQVKTLDANDKPVAVEGRVKVTRDVHYEIWVAPDGQEVAGEELKGLREKTIFPPPPEPGRNPWRLKAEGYEHDEILTRTVKTDAEGEAEIVFTAEREGFYRTVWTGGERDEVTAETMVWVATNATSELGYRHGGLEIIADKDTFRAGETAPVMLHVPANDRYVLFSVEGENLYSYQLVHLTGTVKLLQLPIEERHVPNVFLSGAMVSDGQFYFDTKQVVVPPVRHFLDVKVEADREQYQPGEKGTLRVKAMDADGKPVAAEVALSLVDESVFYIQEDYAGDPREFFYGSKRSQQVQTQSTFQQKSYGTLDRAKDGAERRESKLDDVRSDSVAFGMAGASRSRAAGGMPMAKMMAAPASAPMEERSMLMSAMSVADEAAPQGAEPAVQVRSDFRSTVLWNPVMKTAEDGTASVEVTYPDSLTSWRATARAATAGNQFGIGKETTRTKMPLIVRLQAPRFFVVKDSVIVSAVINNNTDADIEVTPELTAEGGVEMKPAALEAITVPAGGERRVDRRLEVKEAGTLKLKAVARGGGHSDAMEKSYEVHQHGIERFVAKSGKARGTDVTVKLEIPKERKADSTSLTVQVAPSIATTMLDALPYLADYPYGCTEQTMSRFLPAAIVRKTLTDLGMDGSAIVETRFGGIEEEHTVKTQPKGREDLKKLDDMVSSGLERLYDFQHGDGGWGWWKDGESDHYMTAYVLWGLELARGAGIAVRGGVIDRARSFLDKELVEQEDNVHLQAWMLHALAAGGGTASELQKKAFENCWTKRDELNGYTRALLAMSAHGFGFTDRAKVLVENLRNGVERDATPDTSVVMRGEKASDPSVLATAHWGEERTWFRWWEGGVEATAFALRALMAIDPGHELVEPAMNWLVKNRRGGQWSNTRDTAICVLALNDYLKASGELKPEVEYELLVNGTSVAKKNLSGEDALSAPSRFAIEPGLIRDGENEIRIRRENGDSPLYFAAEAEFFSLEEPVPAAGNEIFVRRQYYKLVPRPTLLKGFVHDRKALNDGESVASGERIETIVTIEAKNDYEYLVFEDLKPAGIEAVEVRSGEPVWAKEVKSRAVDRGNLDAPRAEEDFTGKTRSVHREWRDRMVVSFLDRLPQGVWELRYEVRAEVPGTFHALPVMGHAMYVPEIRCNGAEIVVAVTD